MVRSGNPQNNKVNAYGYVERLLPRILCSKKRYLQTYTNTWMVKYGDYSTTPIIKIGATQVYFPKEYIGKRIRLKVEVVEDK